MDLRTFKLNTVRYSGLLNLGFKKSTLLFPTFLLKKSHIAEEKYGLSVRARQENCHKNCLFCTCLREVSMQHSENIDRRSETADGGSRFVAPGDDDDFESRSVVVVVSGI